MESNCPNCGKPLTVVIPEDLAAKRVEVGKLPLEPPRPKKCMDCDYKGQGGPYIQ